VDPIWASLAEFWWIGPTVIGAGTLGWFGLRHQRSERARRLEYEAARHDLKAARTNAASARIGVRVARAELARVQAERAASRATGAEVAAARTALDRAQRDGKAAAAAVRVGRVHVRSARAALPAAANDPASLPLARLLATHDDIAGRWLEYETDPAKLIAFPAMSDGRSRLTAAFLTEQRSAQRLRPASPTARMTPTQFGAYRDAVHRMRIAFEAAETDAWRQARAAGSAPAGPGPDTPPARATLPRTVQHWTEQLSGPWSDAAQNLTQAVIAKSADALARATGTGAPREDTARAAEPIRTDSTAGRTADAPPGRSADAPRAQAAAAQAAAAQAAATRPEERPMASGRGDDPSAGPPSVSGRDDGPSAEAGRRDASTSPVWPVPSRSRRPDAR